MNHSDPNTASTLDSEAALWHVRRQDGLDAAEEAQFQAWLAAGAGRHEACVRFERTWQDLDALPPQAVARLIASARSQPAMHAAGAITSAGSPQSNTAPAATTLTAPSTGAGVPRRQAGPRSWLAAWHRLAAPMATAMLAIGVAGAGWLGWSHWQAQPVFSHTYATARGELLDVALPDGSVLKLDTATSAEVTLYRDRRQVRLPEGQAMFTVTPDAARPFDVLTGSMRVTVVGTRFSVRNTRSGLAQEGAGVQVEEGKVRVAMLDHGRPVGEPVLLTAGQSVQSDRAGHLAPVQRHATRGAMLWREGRVDFERTPLAQAVAEFERYGATRLVIRDPAVAALTVNGSFDLRQADAFSRTLPLVLPVRLKAQGGETEIAAAPK